MSTSGDLGGDDHPAERRRTTQPENQGRTILARQVCFVLHFVLLGDCFASLSCKLSNCHLSFFVCLFFMFLFFVHLQKKKKDKTVHMIILSPTQSDEPFTKMHQVIVFSLQFSQVTSTILSLQPR